MIYSHSEKLENQNRVRIEIKDHLCLPFQGPTLCTVVLFPAFVALP